MRLATASAALLHSGAPREGEDPPMPYSSYRPDLMGSATLMPVGSFEAGSIQSFELVYAAGAFGIDDSGSIKIGFSFRHGFRSGAVRRCLRPGVHHGGSIQWSDTRAS